MGARLCLVERRSGAGCGAGMTGGGVGARMCRSWPLLLTHKVRMITHKLFLCSISPLFIDTQGTTYLKGYVEDKLIQWRWVNTVKSPIPGRLWFPVTPISFMSHTYILSLVNYGSLLHPITPGTCKETTKYYILLYFK